ncbi:protein of unknown function [Aquimarina amphilecti]|uniref:DUF4349 domain-containing protein n=1 Tax=Aquimarina amphilecti TaxID=1038014 RepID=A0A1H7UYE6_AQUAM|nr:DUF4349 domain-containing protein [Aquimarina amphilecti]SEM01537.1 protein of unknown function [Aquimarina amphilecti]
MKTNILKLIGISCLVISFSCSRAEKNYELSTENIIMEDTGETPVLNAVEIESDTDIISEKGSVNDRLKIIKNASCRIKVRNVEEATILSKNIASAYKGYVSDERFTNTNYSKENRFTIRIPQNKFDQVLDSICALAEFVDHKNISTIDVTEEYIDVSSRLKTKLEVKQRYETILRTKAKNVEDILLAEDKLRELQEEIEAAQGKLKYMSNKISFSTIQLDMYETVSPKDEPEKYVESFIDRAKDGLSFGWNLLQHLFLVLFYVWPLLLLGVLILIYFKWIRK